MITHRPMCAACSTPHNGVNYSKEGLRVVLERERSAAEPREKLPVVFLILTLAAFPICLLVSVSFWHASGQFVIDFMQSLRQ